MFLGTITESVLGNKTHTISLQTEPKQELVDLTPGRKMDSMVQYM